MIRSQIPSSITTGCTLDNSRIVFECVTYRCFIGGDVAYLLADVQVCCFLCGVSVPFFWRERK